MMELKNIFKKSKNVKYLELVLIFMVSPIILLIEIPISLKISYLSIGIIYISLISIFIEDFSKPKIDNNQIKNVFKQIGFFFLIIGSLTTLVLYFQDKDSLFNVILFKPLLWVKFSGIYILFSVIPQELIYRTFFIKRYKELINNKWLFILFNAILFSFAHIWFKSWIVLSFTFIGSLLFTNTYLNTKSTWLVILEHSLYGVWLYTVGYGALFMFPV